ncbi:MAG: hypothetical protein IT312_15880 [Anaerolineales bacterium]|nr:hypothetical protein [Anaerolineales bacterium]
MIEEQKTSTPEAKKPLSLARHSTKRRSGKTRITNRKPPISQPDSA